MADNASHQPNVDGSENPFTNPCFVANFCRIPDDASGNELRKLFLDYATEYTRAYALEARCKRHAAERNMRMLDALEQRRGLDDGGSTYAQPVTQRWFSAAPAYNPQDVYPDLRDDAWSDTFADNNLQERPSPNEETDANEMAQQSDSDFDSESTVT